MNVRAKAPDEPRAARLFHFCGGLPQPDWEYSRSEILRFHAAIKGMHSSQT